jgi:photosystem II PsbU protein
MMQISTQCFDFQDIYSIPGVTANDKAMFKKYQAELTVLPPGRMFKERINQRQST